MISAFYNPDLSYRDAVTAAPFEKFPLVHQDWRQRFGDCVTFPEFRKAEREDLVLAHDPAFVDGLLSGTVRNPVSGLNPSGTAAAAWEVGAILTAVERTKATGLPSVAIAAGFHHAGYRKAHAFCTFNGLMVAAIKLKKAGLRGKVGILDLDAHFGDGTYSIIEELKCAGSVRHYSFAQQMVDREDVDEWLSGLPDAIREFQADGVEFLLYYSGCDPHEHDPMVKGVMTTEQMRLRERAVFRTAKTVGLPVCWTLGGGYQKPWSKMVELHGLAMEECIRAHAA